ncbi:DUF1405 domain-containing protein [Paenibacillus aurantiacus]|uniref:DUF1405 domain-containing protein n=1 Tax=Paenibacillus aurantiacus TaxID=1936118 RepID=A0ABV5KWK0_9BACL
MSLFSFLVSRAVLLDRRVLWLLLVVNALGTVYGYYWYGDQLIDTSQTQPAWQLVFVPDSPTASLFFTLALIYLLFPLSTSAGPVARGIRMIIEALGVVTSVKYGIWAVVMIVAGAMKGDQLVWQHYMLIVSHLSMAIEGLLFVRFFTFGRWAAFAAGCWLWLNDTMDYTYNIYPWLPEVLDRVVQAVRNFTFGLTLFSLLLTLLFLQLGRKARRIEA